MLTHTSEVSTAVPASCVVAARWEGAAISGVRTPSPRRRGTPSRWGSGYHESRGSSACNGFRERFQRRVFGRHLSEALERSRKLGPRARFARAGFIRQRPETAYVFLV